MGSLLAIIFYFRKDLIGILKNKDLNELKDSILKLVNKVPEITSEHLQQDMVTKGFTIHIKKIMQSNYPSRLNLDLKTINDENINRAFLELIDLIEIKKLVYLKNRRDLLFKLLTILCFYLNKRTHDEHRRTTARIRR